jgi:DNA-binding winged helix-turn-helix (wHTH) protein/Tol biopolymer transport system component
MMAGKSFIFSFDDVEVHEREFTLVKAGEVLPVEPKAFRVLLILLRNPGKLIGKEDLLNAVWGDAAVTDNSLARSIALLRRLLGDETRNPRYIETVATVGYRFICKVEVLEDASRELEGIAKPAIPVSGESAAVPASGEAADAATAPPQTNAGGDGKKPAGTRKRLPGWLIPGAVVFAAGVAAGIWYLHRPLPPPRITKYEQITHDHLSKFLAGTDGTRLYFTLYFPTSIRQIGVTGGETAPIPVSLPPGGTTIVRDVSSDGSSLLLWATEDKKPGEFVWVAPVLGGSAHSLGRQLGDTIFSPDGNSVAYIKPLDEIWTIQRDGSGARKLASVGGIFGWLARSPDGSTFRFTRSDSQLWEVSSNGANLHQFLPGWRPQEWKCCGRWSSDGKTFYFVSGTSPLWGVPGAGGQIWAFSEQHGPLLAGKSDPVQLTTGPMSWMEPLPAKDGKKVFAIGITQRGELTRSDPRTRELKPFLGGISAEGLAFSQDGKFMVYVSFPEGVLWKADWDGSNPVQLTEPPLYVFGPRWSPDGTQILFQNLSTNGPSSVFILRADGGAPRRILPDDNNAEVDPTWSPDGGRVLFSSGVVTDPKSWKLKILELASGQATVVPGSTDKFSPRWSPDGRLIASVGSGDLGLKVFDFKTQQWSSLPVTGDFSLSPCWSKDSQFLYFLLNQKGVHGVFRIRLHGTKAEQVADLKDWHLAGARSFGLGLDPDDAPLLLRDIGSQDIYALTLEEK